MRLANNAAIENAIVHRVDGKWLLISEGAEDAWPYWVNFDEVLLFQEKAPSRKGEEPARVVDQADERLVNVDSMKAFADRLAKLSIPLPGGKKWEELGYLQQSEWTQALDQAARPVFYPGNITVESVKMNSYSGNLVVAGKKQLEASESASFHPSGAPAPMSASVPSFNSWDDEFHFHPSWKSRLETLKKGDVLKVWVSVYPSISYNGGPPRCTVQIGNRVELR